MTIGQIPGQVGTSDDVDAAAPEALSPTSPFGGWGDLDEGEIEVILATNNDLLLAEKYEKDAIDDSEVVS